jgi:hypothetical protein
VPGGPVSQGPGSSKGLGSFSLPWSAGRVWLSSSHPGPRTTIYSLLGGPVWNFSCHSTRPACPLVEGSLTRSLSSLPFGFPSLAARSVPPR